MRPATKAHFHAVPFSKPLRHARADREGFFKVGHGPKTFQTSQPASRRETVSHPRDGMISPFLFHRLDDLPNFARLVQELITVRMNDPVRRNGLHTVPQGPHARVGIKVTGREFKETRARLLTNAPEAGGIIASFNQRRHHQFCRDRAVVRQPERKNVRFADTGPAAGQDSGARRNAACLFRDFTSHVSTRMSGINQSPVNPHLSGNHVVCLPRIHQTGKPKDTKVSL
jgi:hypothetical protein